jgi:hypothetical protein
VSKPWIKPPDDPVARLSRAARSIDDPVFRLRFLRTEAPRVGHAWRRFRRPGLRMVLVVALPAAFLIGDVARRAAVPAPIPPRALQTTVSPAPAAVWLVEQSSNSEVYSNGLRIDTRFTVSNRARAYLAFPRDAGAWESRHGVRRAEPAGIVYHTTESCQAPFEPRATEALKNLGESLIAYVQRRRAYHYLIDRFGRVFRIVAESDSAEHAGYSAWADRNWFYLNLNESFLGISFEAQTQAAQEVANPAQIRSAAMLTEMLRSRYAIPAEDCVTHAQVSVNPSNMLAGYHTDWASGFPFASLGLPDNYRQPPTALWAFGFESDPAWLAAGKDGVARGAGIALADVNHAAAAARLRPAAYRRTLRERYHAWLAAARHAGSRAD